MGHVATASSSFLPGGPSSQPKARSLERPCREAVQKYHGSRLSRRLLDLLGASEQPDSPELLRVSPSAFPTCPEAARGVQQSAKEKQTTWTLGRVPSLRPAQHVLHA